jgi:hypothetical protein
MPEWRTPIRCYVSPAGNNKILDWYQSLGISERTFVDEFLKNMRKTKDWSLPDYRPRLAGYKKIGELRWLMNKTQHRLIGFFANGVWYAVLGCTHKQNVYSPADALKTADKYRKQIENKEVATVEYDL